jgi:hypothetical protein
VTLDKRTVALGTAAAAAVAAAVTVTAVNRHGDSRERRAVTAYIDAVNGVQNEMHAPLTRVMLAYRDFAEKSTAKRRAAATELAGAEVTLARLRRRLAATAAPAEARKLRRLLLDLIDRQVSITREVRGMATFSPRFARVLAGARTANTELSAALGAVRPPVPHNLRGTKKQVLAAQRAYQRDAQAAANAQAEAIDRYDAAIEHVVRRLRTLEAPPAFAVGVTAQIRALTDTVEAGAELATELRKAQRQDIAVLGRRFTVASREAQDVATQRAQIAAIRAYNTRAREVSSAAGQVQDELLRLQRTLP